jgi:Bardet-Biedl syndrome 4 protein
MMHRRNGQIVQSLDILQQCAIVNPLSANYLKQIARSLYLMGKHAQSIELFNESIKIDNNDSVYFRLYK